eukprot:CAMPEP_0167810604 /NCGR_PEP_ID=MMETSP0112_2-20121227/180_1 /TAXON_ID=91324 /ORGANISM="Lotharella globosa, Strain CCCM811" /LENGTH=78 /DNA_ID=CAMNT_0007709173 /DNA_START=915 /DNA_END=1150 /DNA_ORIENTATION=-
MRAQQDGHKSNRHRFNQAAADTAPCPSGVHKCRPKNEQPQLEDVTQAVNRQAQREGQVAYFVARVDIGGKKAEEEPAH